MTIGMTISLTMTMLWISLSMRSLRNRVKSEGGKGGCLGIVVLLLLPMASVILLSWK
jgi:hypothetical protein